MCLILDLAIRTLSSQRGVQRSHASLASNEWNFAATRRAHRGGGDPRDAAAFAASGVHLVVALLMTYASDVLGAVLGFSTVGKI